MSTTMTEHTSSVAVALATDAEAAAIEEGPEQTSAMEHIWCVLLENKLGALDSFGARC